MSNIEKLNAISQPIDELKELRHKEEIIVPNCESCGKRIVGTKWNKEYNDIKRGFFKKYLLELNDKGLNINILIFVKNQ